MLLISKQQMLVHAHTTPPGADILGICLHCGFCPFSNKTLKTGFPDLSWHIPERYFSSPVSSKTEAFLFLAIRFGLLKFALQANGCCAVEPCVIVLRPTTTSVINNKRSQQTTTPDCLSHLGTTPPLPTRGPCRVSVKDSSLCGPLASKCPQKAALNTCRGAPVRCTRSRYWGTANLSDLYMCLFTCSIAVALWRRNSKKYIPLWELAQLCL